MSSVYENLQDTRTKVAPVNVIYGSHFSATEATHEVSQNIENFVESLYLQEVDVNELPFMESLNKCKAYLCSCLYIYPL